MVLKTIEKYTRIDTELEKGIQTVLVQVANIHTSEVKDSTQC